MFAKKPEYVGDRVYIYVSSLDLYVCRPAKHGPGGPYRVVTWGLGGSLLYIIYGS